MFLELTLKTYGLHAAQSFTIKVLRIFIKELRTNARRIWGMCICVSSYYYGSYLVRTNDAARIGPSGPANSSQVKLKSTPQKLKPEIRRLKATSEL